jgi:putative FmdB family regulatory protein
MPAYEYQCLSCETHFEHRQKMSDRAIESCPQCGGSVRRLISGGAGVVSRGASSAPAPRSACGAGEACCMSQSPCASSACAWEN